MDACFEDWISIHDKAASGKKKRYGFGSKRRPAVGGWVSVIKEYPDGGAKIACELDGEGQVFELLKKPYEFLMALDGHTGIEDAAEAAGISSEDADYYLEFFAENSLIRTGRRIGCMFSLVGRHEINPAFAKVFNAALSCLFLPVFVLGCILFFRYDVYGMTTIKMTVPLYIAIVLASLVVTVITHEFCHATGCDGTVFDGGIFFAGLFGGYVLGRRPKNRGRAIRYELAGIKGNLILAGISGALSFNPDMYLVFSTAFFLNVVAAAWNILPILTVSDGFCVLCELLRIRQDCRDRHSLWRNAVRSFRAKDWLQGASLLILLTAGILIAGMLIIGEGTVIIDILTSL